MIQLRGCPFEEGSIMKKKLFGGLIAVAFVSLATDEIRLHRVIQNQNGAVERLTAEVGDLQRAAADRKKTLSAARNLALVPNSPNVTTNGSATLFNIAPGNARRRSAFPFASPSQQQTPPEVPPHWQPFEFNGQTYYRIPLANVSPEPLGFRP
jgi:hypothetical protein